MLSPWPPMQEALAKATNGIPPWAWDRQRILRQAAMMLISASHRPQPRAGATRRKTILYHTRTGKPTGDQAPNLRRPIELPLDAPRD